MGQLPLQQVHEQLVELHGATMPESLPHRLQSLRLQFRLPARRSRRMLPAATLGTETDGSIVCPSSTCGIVGIKPTVGLVSRAGVIPIAHSRIRWGR